MIKIVSPYPIYLIFFVLALNLSSLSAGAESIFGDTSPVLMSPRQQLRIDKLG